ncbi:hypothetical protein T45_09352 [Streptomyces turgidiscabies]|nr:hypothetical protein T45_09352 [Streptomyces turgidiscabies]
MAGAAQAASAPDLAPGRVQGDDRPDPAGGPGRAAQAAAHRQTGLRPADRRARRPGHHVFDGPRLHRPAPSGDPSGGGPRSSAGVRAADPPPRRRGGGRLRGRVDPPGRGAHQGVPVLAAAVVQREGRAQDLRFVRAGSIPGRPRPRTSGAGRRAARQGPLRQLAGRGQPGSGPHPGPGGKRPLDGVPLALLDQQLLLQSRHRGRPRETCVITLHLIGSLRSVRGPGRVGVAGR